jgi:flagellar basal-body rod protein FlgF
MDRLIYLSMAGAKATLQRQDVLAHNLANVSTNGFRAELAAFRAVPVRGDGASTRVYALESTVGYSAARPGADHRPRRWTWPCRARPGWRCRRWTAPRPTRAPARWKSMPRASWSRAAACRCWATAARSPCRPMRGGGHRPDGSVSTTVGNAAAGGGPAEAGDARGGAARGTDGLFRAPAGDLPADAAARLQRGALEGSNVSPVETMVAMISAARQFEQQMKMLQGAEQREQAAAKLLAAARLTRAPARPRSAPPSPAFLAIWPAQVRATMVNPIAPGRHPP